MCLLSKKEKSLLYDTYFEVIRETQQFIEVKSVNTGHCWSVFKNEYDRTHQITLYHKAQDSAANFQEFRLCRNVTEAVEMIKAHDEEVLERLKKRAEQDTASMNRNDRRLKITSSSGRNYKPTATLILKGDWLENVGFETGEYVNVKCEDGKLTITREENKLTAPG